MEQEIAQLEQALQKLVGATCDGIIYTNPEQVSIRSRAYYRPFQLLNDGSYMPLIYLSFDKYHIGMLGLWQIFKDGEQVCGYVGALNNDGLLLKNINRLKGCAVKQVNLDYESLAVAFTFDKQYSLEIVQVKGLLCGFEYRYARHIWQVINGEIGHDKIILIV